MSAPLPVASPAKEKTTWELKVAEIAEAVAAPPAGVEAPAIAPVTGPVDNEEFEMTGWDGALNTSRSITSSIYQHSWENGRRFHSYQYGRYPIPNDEIEQNREDMKHAMMLEITDGKLYYAPIGNNVRKIIDMGTGTGIWAIEVADQMPSAEILGIDLSPIQPKWVPPNCRFLVDDAEEEWLNGDDHDMVHMRSMSSVLQDIPKVLRHAYSALKPGGWLEMQELQAVLFCDDKTMPEDDGLLKYYKTLDRALTRFGMDLEMPCKLGPFLEQAGFVNLHHIHKKVPVGPWAEDRQLRVAGLYLREAILDLIPATASKSFRALGLSEIECEVIAMGARQALQDMSRHRYLPFHFWVAQKPT